MTEASALATRLASARGEEGWGKGQPGVRNDDVCSEVTGVRDACNQTDETALNRGVVRIRFPTLFFLRKETAKISKLTSQLSESPLSALMI